MKYVLLACSLGCVTSVNAQSDSLLKKNEIGLFAEMPLTGQPNYSTIGVKYNRWHNSHLGYSLLAGYSSYENYPGFSHYKVANDTLTGRYSYEHANLIVAGAGIEAQRHFYKRTYLFAGIDLKVGYGTGRVDSTINSYPLPVNDSNNYKSSSIPGSNLSMYVISLSPNIGAKLAFNHFLLGIQTSFQLTNSNIKYSAGQPEHTSSLDIGSLYNQVFIQFRF